MVVVVVVVEVGVEVNEIVLQDRLNYRYRIALFSSLVFKCEINKMRLRKIRD